MVARKMILELVDEVCSPLFSTEWGKRLSIGAVALSVSILLYIVVSILIDWHSNMLAFRAANKNSVSSENNLAELVLAIPNGHLFGKYGVLEKNAHLPITSLQIELTGLIEAKPGSSSRVIITEGGKPGKVYQIGDTLQSGVRINSIESDGVVLENGGQLEKLPLRRQPLTFQREIKPLGDKKEKENHTMSDLPESMKVDQEEP